MYLPPDLEGLRLVIVGKTGSGKSSSGNTILGSPTFHAAAKVMSVTQQCGKQSGQVSGREVSIVDTPGLYDTKTPDESVKREISKCINMSAPGPHAILLVIKLGRFSEEEQNAVRQVEALFGPDAWRFTVVLFTHRDKMPADVDIQREAVPELRAVLEKAGNRFSVFNNLRINDRGQVLDLLEKVEEMVEANGGQFYSNPTYQQTVQIMERREAELKKFYEEKLAEQKESVRAKYERMLREAREEEKKLGEKRREAELQELTRYYHALESGVRRVTEQMVDSDSQDEVFLKFHETLRLN